MASSANNFVSREEYKNIKALEEARKAGKAPAALDEEGKEINPHMPAYMLNQPWYVSRGSQPTLSHLKFYEAKQGTSIDSWYARGQFGKQNTKYKKGACSNCGSSTHDVKFCFSRPRTTGAQFTNSDIQPDDIIVDLDLDYESKRDRWNGYDADTYKEVINEFEVYDAERQRVQEQDLERKIGEENLDEYREGADGKGTSISNFASTDTTTKTTGRDLRLREDTAKYMLNLDVNSAYFDPKTRSMRENPNPHLDEDKQTFKGENFLRLTGDTNSMYQQEYFAWDHSEKHGADLNSIAQPSLTESIYKKMIKSEIQLKENKKNKLLDKYGGSEHFEGDIEMAAGQSENYNEFNAEGRVIQKSIMNHKSKSRYQEDVYNNNHSCVWGSWYNENLGWGYKCCHGHKKESVCSGERGIREAIISEYKYQREKDRSLGSFVDNNEKTGDELEKDNINSVVNTEIDNVNNADFPIPSKKIRQVPQEQVIAEVSAEDDNEEDSSSESSESSSSSDSSDSDSSSSGSEEESASEESSKSSKKASKRRKSNSREKKSKSEIESRILSQFEKIRSEKHEKINEKEKRHQRRDEQRDERKDDRRNEKKDDRSKREKHNKEQRDEKQDDYKKGDSDKYDRRQDRDRSKSPRNKKERKIREKEQKKIEANPFARSGDMAYESKDLDQDKIKKAMRDEEKRLKSIDVEKDDRKRKYNSAATNTKYDFTAEEVEAYRMKKKVFDDPMNKFT